MTEGENRVPIDELAKYLRAGERPIDQYVARTLEEIYSSGQYRGAVLSPAGADLDEPQVALGIRFVSLRDGNLFTAVTSLVHGRPAIRRLQRSIETETARLFVHRGDFDMLEPLALEALGRAGLQTAAAMQISERISDGKELTSVIYPKPFMGIISVEPMVRMVGYQPPTGADLNSDLGLIMGMHFLKRIPYSPGDMIITSPSR